MQEAPLKEEKYSDSIFILVSYPIAVTKQNGIKIKRRGMYSDINQNSIQNQNKIFIKNTFLLDLNDQQLDFNPVIIIPKIHF